MLCHEVCPSVRRNVNGLQKPKAFQVTDIPRNAVSQNARGKHAVKCRSCRIAKVILPL